MRYQAAFWSCCASSDAAGHSSAAPFSARRFAQNAFKEAEMRSLRSTGMGFFGA
jgi:hypothetical protein